MKFKIFEKVRIKSREKLIELFRQQSINSTQSAKILNELEQFRKSKLNFIKYDERYMPNDLLCNLAVDFSKEKTFYRTILISEDFVEKISAQMEFDF